MADSGSTPADRLQVEAAIREVEHAYDTAWRAGDLEGLLACLSPDAVMINPFGEIAEGQAQIRQELAKVLSRSRAQNHTSVISRVALVTQDVAVVDGDAVLEGAGDAASFRHRFTDVLVKRPEGWVVAHVRAYRHEERPG